MPARAGDAVAVRPDGRRAREIAARVSGPSHDRRRNRSSACSSQAPASSSETIPAHWQLPAERIVAIAFTSGSTGDSTPHPKTWGSLFHNSRLAAAEVLGGTNRTLVSTVPPQHMYGLEASLLSALTAQSVLFDDKPFFPADVRRALEAMPAPRVLVTTPAHLQGAGGCRRRTTAAGPRRLGHRAVAGRARAAHRNRVEYAARGDLWLHRSRRDGASKACAIGKLAHIRGRDDDDVSGRRRISRAAARRRPCRCRTFSSCAAPRNFFCAAAPRT